MARESLLVMGARASLGVSERKRSEQSLQGHPHSSRERALGQLWGHLARAAPVTHRCPSCSGRRRGWAQPPVHARHSLTGTQEGLRCWVWL